MKKHTPGPWTTDPVFGDDELSIILGYEVLGKGNPILIGTTFQDDDEGFIDRKTAFANARLIAAAPDLLEGCQSIATAFEGADPWDEFQVGEILKVLNKVRAAIARATVGKES
jgi:hypothetical protein